MGQKAVRKKDTGFAEIRLSTDPIMLVEEILSIPVRITKI